MRYVSIVSWCYWCKRASADCICVDGEGLDITGQADKAEGASDA